MDNRTLGYSTEIVLVGFNDNQPLVGKIDTGADVSSLHANDIVMINDNLMVKFRFGDKIMTMPITGFQSVRSADGGVENRPLVKFDVEVHPEGEESAIQMKGITFNLNDRSGLADRILLGLNFIQAGKFTIVDDNKTPEEFDDGTEKIIEDNSYDVIALQNQLKKLFELQTLLKESGLTIKEIKEKILT